MRFLLDTHTFLWWDAEPQKLSKSAYDAIEDEANEIYLSLISIWEIQIKVQLGKLSLETSLKQVIEQQKRDNNIRILALNEAQIFGLATLPYHHKDPFDRLLISQAIYENLGFITDDGLIQPYGISILW